MRVHWSAKGSVTRWVGPVVAGSRTTSSSLSSRLTIEAGRPLRHHTRDGAEFCPGASGGTVSRCRTGYGREDERARDFHRARPKGER